MKQNNIKPSYKDYFIHGIFLLFFGIFKYLPLPLGSSIRLIFCKLFFKKLGKVRISDGVTIFYPYKIKISDNTTLNENVYINGFGNLSIAENVRIGHGTSILTSDHNIPNRNEKIIEAGLIAQATVIEKDVFIGCNVTVLGGSTIGEGAVIAAGAVVKGKVPPFSIVGGVPAKVLAYRD